MMSLFIFTLLEYIEYSVKILLMYLPEQPPYARSSLNDLGLKGGDSMVITFITVQNTERKKDDSFHVRP